LKLLVSLAFSFTNNLQLLTGPFDSEFIYFNSHWDLFPTVEKCSFDRQFSFDSYEVIFLQNTGKPWFSKKLKA
jgi:hypothetical protein